MPTYFNPNLFPFQAEQLGDVLGMADGQVKKVVQVNGIAAGAPIFQPPQALVEGLGSFDGLPAKFDDLTMGSGLSLGAKDSAAALIFTTKQAELLLPHMMGVSYVNPNRTPPPTKTGWYDTNNPTATKFGALNLTKYELGQSLSIARENIVAVQLGAALTAYPGDLIMAAYALNTDFDKVAPALTRVTEDSTGEAGVSDHILANKNVVEVETAHIKATKVDEWVLNASYLKPSVLATDIQLYDLATNDGVCEIIYKYWAAGIPIEMISKCVLGKCVAASGIAGEVIGLEVW